MFPLALRGEAGENKQLARTILAVDEGSQSMTSAGHIPRGSLAQRMRGSFAVAISGIGRRVILGERTEGETEAIQDVLPPDTHQIGFYSYGEISSFRTGSDELHYQTMTLTTFGEA